MHQQAVRAFLRRQCLDASEADDLAQEAFVAAWSRMTRFEGRSSFRSWLCGIGYRKALTARRTMGRARKRDADYLQARDLEGEEGADLAARPALRRAMSALPDDQRAVVALCLAGDFSHAEAADALGLPLGTVKSHVNRGRARLLELLGGAR